MPDHLLRSWEAAGRLFLFPIAGFPLFTFVTSLAVAALVMALRLRARGRVPRLRVLARALFPARLVRGGSAHVDLAFTAFNLVLPGLLFGWMILSGVAIASRTRLLLEQVFGTLAPSSWPTPLLVTLGAIAAMVAYEFGYWLDHWLKHRVPFLWEFHKVHHAAEHLSFLTQYRVHPIDSVILVNILAITGGVVQGATHWLFGHAVEPLAVAGINVILLAGLATFVHLQHTHVWLAFTGIWGRVLLSPAHHQLHHSVDPDHHGHNLGSMFALFDWLFGTLLVPTRKRQRLRFGVGPEDVTTGDVVASFCLPFVRAWHSVVPRRVRERPARAVDAPIV